MNRSTDISRLKEIAGLIEETYADGVGINPVEGDNRRPAMASFSRGVLHVEVEVFTRLHHGGLTFPNGFQALLLASPCHHRRVRTQSAMVLNVVPTHHHLALLHDDVLHPSHEVSVQFFHVLVAHLLQFFVELSYDFVGIGNGDAQFLCYFRRVNQSVVH